MMQVVAFAIVLVVWLVEIMLGLWLMSYVYLALVAWGMRRAGYEVTTQYRLIGSELRARRVSERVRVSIGRSSKS